MLDSEKKYSIFFIKKKVYRQFYYNFISTFFNKQKLAGPDIVVKNVLNQFNNLGIEYNVNPPLSKINRNVLVLSDHKILFKLILKKKKLFL